MKILISGKQVKLGQSIQQYVEERISRSVHKYFERAIQSDIKFGKQGSMFSCDIIVNEGTGLHLIIKSDSQSDDIYTAFDSALIKIEKQLRKYKSKIKDHHKKPITDLPLDENKLLIGTKYIIEPYKETIEQEDNPIVIAEKATNIDKMTVSEAVMKMDLTNAPAMVFINKANDRVNMVYYRRDGNISWVDPGEVKELVLN